MQSRLRQPDAKLMFLPGRASAWFACGCATNGWYRFLVRLQNLYAIWKLRLPAWPSRSSRMEDTLHYADVSTAADQAPVNRRVSTIPRSEFHESMTWWAQRIAAGLHLTTRCSLGEGFGILAYHRVAEKTPGYSTPSVNVTPARLRSQLAGLLDRGFEAWSLPEVLAAWHTSTPIPGNVFVVTFDDGYANNLLDAVPILEDLKVPATIFLATAYLDSNQPFPFESWSCAGSSGVPAKSWQPLTTAQCHTLQENELIELGVHTHTHDVFSNKVDDFRRDMEMALAVMDVQFGIREPTFSFPFGLTTPEMTAIVRELGVSCALTTRAERVHARLDPFHWGRFTASDLDSATTLSAKLNGWYTPVSDLLRLMKRPLVRLGLRMNDRFITPDPSSQ